MFQKLFKELYKTASMYERGTASHYKVVTQSKSVTGKVKTNFKVGQSTHFKIAQLCTFSQQWTLRQWSLITVNSIKHCHSVINDYVFFLIVQKHHTQAHIHCKSITRYMYIIMHLIL